MCGHVMQQSDQRCKKYQGVGSSQSAVHAGPGTHQSTSPIGKRRKLLSGHRTQAHASTHQVALLCEGGEVTIGAVAARLFLAL